MIQFSYFNLESKPFQHGNKINAATFELIPRYLWTKTLILGAKITWVFNIFTLNYFKVVKKSFCKWLYTCKYVVALSDYSLPLHAWPPHLSQFTVNAVVLWPVAGGKGVSVDCSLHVLPLSLVDPIDQGRQMKPISLWKLGIVLDTTCIYRHIV